MGVPYDEMFVSIDGTECGPVCILPVLEDLLLSHRDVRKRQALVLKYARLFSYCMERNGLQFPDAATALLVHTRHNVHYGNLKVA